MWNRERRCARRAIAIAICPLVLLCVRATALPAQRAPADTVSTATPSDRIDSLVRRSLAVSPTVAAAAARVDAAVARVGPGGARPDPVLTVGIENLPLGHESSLALAGEGSTANGPDPMTMRTIGVSQRLPFPGKLALQERAAQRDVDAARAMLLAARLDVARQVREAYYDVAFADQALLVISRQQDVLTDIVRVTEARYAAGKSAQHDVLTSRIQAAQLGDEAATLLERRRGAVAALNALLDQPSEAVVAQASVPERVVRAAVSDSASEIHFAAQSLGARVADSPLLPLDSIQNLAIANSPMLREHEARIAAQAARLALAEKATRPDIDVSLQYGQRNGLTDMLTAQISVPIPLQHARKQDLDVAAARDELAALHEEHEAQINELRARTATLVDDLERDRTQLALDVKAVLPQGRVALSAATVTYDAGTGALTSVLDARATLLDYETQYLTTLTDFAKQLAELEQVAGADVLREAAP